jgi:DNA-directed RNA polymerase subunit RPC12/RpoP
LKLTAKQRAEVVDRVAHQGDGMAWAMNQFDLEVDEVEDIMLDANYERCPGCGWFVECGELVDADDAERECSNCDSRAIGDEEDE